MRSEALQYLNGIIIRSLSVGVDFHWFPCERRNTLPITVHLHVISLFI